MVTTASSPVETVLAERLALTTGPLCEALARRMSACRVLIPLLKLVWIYVRRTTTRFALLEARVARGEPPRVAPSRAGQPRTRPPRPVDPPGLPPVRLQRGYAWLLRYVPLVGNFGTQLQALLAEPEMAAFVAATPQAGRLLRPLCHMLGVRPPVLKRPVLTKPVRTAGQGEADAPASLPPSPNVPVAPPAQILPTSIGLPAILFQPVFRRG